MSTIAAGTTSGTALVTSGDTTGQLVLQTNGTTTAVTIGTNQVVTLAQPLPAASGGTGSTATPTAGGIVYGTGTAQAITAAGTSGQVLQSNGASAPSWATPSTGAMVFLSSVTASSSATVDLETTFDSTYDVYMITASGVVAATDTADLRMRMKIGGSYLTSSYASYTTNLYSSDPSTFRASTNTSAVDVALSVGNTGGRNADLVLYVYNVSSTSLTKFAQGLGVTSDPGRGITQTTFSVVNTNTAALTGIRFFFSVNNITSGVFRLYGIKNS